MLAANEELGTAEGFGVVVACCAGDIRYLRGCLASVRFYLGNIPIALIFDGIANRDLDAVAHCYGARVLSRARTVDPRLRQRSYGWGITKLVSLWESPFPRFLFLDPDIVLWGNVLDMDDVRSGDLVIYLDRAPHSLEWIDRFIYDRGRLQEIFPDFDSAPHINSVFATGAWIGSRGQFDLDEYMRLLDIATANPEVFRCGDQGLFNFLVFRMSDTGAIRYRIAPFPQLHPNDLDTAQLAASCQFKLRPVPRNKACLFHWSGRKPHIFRRTLPHMTQWRLEHYRQAERAIFGARAAVLLEDLPIARRNFAWRLRRLLRLK